MNRTLNNIWQSATRFETNKIAPWIGLRNAIGIAVPLVIGASIGNTTGGLVASSGALNVAFSDGTDPYKIRGRRMLASSFLCSLAVLLGGISSNYHYLSIAGVTVYAFFAGMMILIGTTAADIGAVTLFVFIVYSAQNLAPSKAVASGAAALGGGLLQTLLALIFWPVHRYRPEYRALAQLYRALSRAAETESSFKKAPPASAETTNAQNFLAALSGDNSINAERLRSLLSQAERIRLALLTLPRIQTRLERESQNTAEIAKFRDLASRALRAAADSLETGKPSPAGRTLLQPLTEIAETIRATAHQNQADDVHAMFVDAAWQAEALAGQIRSAMELAEHATPSGGEEFQRHEATHHWALRLESWAASFRANLTLESAAFRHALRLAVSVAIGELIAKALGWQRSYWIPMTIAIILKSDFTATLSRGLLRLAGTFIGLVLATGIFHFLIPSPMEQVLIITIFAFVLRCYGPINYGVLVTALTGLIVFMFAFTGIAPALVIAARGLDTAAGGLIALLGYLIWPTWERTQTSEAIARLLDAYRNYFQTIREAYLNPDSEASTKLDAVRLAARLARTNLEASAARLRTEPGVSKERLSILDTIVADSHRFIHAVMSLEAGITASPPVPARDAFRTFANDVDLTLYYLAAARRGADITPGQLPDLRADHSALIHTGDSTVQRYALVNVETDRITNSLNTLAGDILAWTNSGA